MTENTEIARETCINDLKNKGFIDKVKVNETLFTPSTSTGR